MEVSVRPLWVNSGHRDELRQCPLHPQKRTSFGTVVTSALCHKRTFTTSVVAVAITAADKRIKATPSVQKRLVG